jgi:peptide/nickel transport system permease protein
MGSSPGAGGERHGMAEQTTQREFAAEGLSFRERTRWQRVRGGVVDFIRHKPLGTFGVLIVLFWTLFAVGTLGDGGGWLGIGRYDHLRVFRVANTEFAQARVAEALDGQPADLTQADLRVLFAEADYLGPVAVSAGVVDDLHAYVQEQIEAGTLIDALMDAGLSQIANLEVVDGVYREVSDNFATGTASPTRTDSLAAPSSEHWFGTDRAGQDIYARIAEGSRLSLTVGVFAAAFAIGMGLLIGLTAGYLGGWFDMLSQRLIDAMQAFPPLIFLLLLASVTRQDLKITILALGFLGIADSTRIVRGSVIATRQTQYVESAQAVGASGLRIATRHILPNIMAPVIVFYTIGIGAYILAEAALSFLGLGPIKVSWGKMVSDGRQFIISGGSPWLSLWSGLAITTLVFGFNVAGDALRDVLDPRLRGSR